MKFKIDENLPSEVKELLLLAGFEAETVIDENLSGKSDEIIFEVCKKEDRAVITFDLDFSDIRILREDYNPGVILLRLAEQDRDSVVETIKDIIPHLSSTALKGKLWIVNKKKIRIRE